MMLWLLMLVWLAAGAARAEWRGAFDEGFFAVRAGGAMQGTAFTNAFEYTGADQYWTNTFGVTQVYVKVWGGGGCGGDGSTSPGGGGGFSFGKLTVSANEVLTVIAGAGGPFVWSGVDGSMIYGGGAGIFATGPHAFFGGGRSAIRRDDDTEVITAGGGGGSGNEGWGENKGGGEGGGAVGGAGRGNAPGQGGTQSAGGAGGVGIGDPGRDGSQYAGGLARGYEGGGGGGWYGGGGAGWNEGDAGGGGGSGYIGGAHDAFTSAATNEVPPAIGDEHYQAGMGYGGNDFRASGNNGFVVIYWRPE